MMNFIVKSQMWTVIEYTSPEIERDRSQTGVHGPENIEI